MLEQLARRYGTDKLGNGYIKYYENHFGSIREEVKSVLEIGVLNGASVRMWRDYFPNAQIVGADINNCLHQAGDRIIVEHGDISSQKFADKLKETYNSFDIIIDDASHLTTHQVFVLEQFLPMANKWFVMEDLGTQLRDGITNGRHTNVKDYTTLDKLGDKVKELNRSVCKDYSEMHFYRWICFIKRS